MDYDDKEIAPKSTQIVGEEDGKFPPGLRSCALPKFDLDDHLQVHLRFDSLGETGILLDISNQTEDHWIEDYSREDSNILVLDPVSRLEFGVIAEESCTISRSNNVWSEAASSESVEMLLNSVGQDEMTTDKGDAAKPDAFDTLDKLNKQMSSGFCQSDSPSNAGIVSSADSAIPLDSCPKSLTSLEKDAVKVMPHVEIIPECHGNTFECRSLGNHDQMINDSRESDTGSPSNLLERISTVVESSQKNVSELLLNDKKWPEDECVKGLVPRQAESNLPSGGPSNGDSVVDDTVPCVSAFSNAAAYEKIVSQTTDFPATEPDTREGAPMLRDTSNKLFCQEPLVTDNANVTNDDIPGKDAETNDDPVEHEFVGNKCGHLSKTCLAKDNSLVVTKCGLVQRTTAFSNLAEDMQDFSQSVDFCSVEVQATNVKVVDGLDLTTLQKRVSHDIADSSMVNPTLVHNSSEVLMSHCPESHSMGDHSLADVHFSGSPLKDASQQSCGNSMSDHATVLSNDTLASLGLDTSKADYDSSLGDRGVRSPQDLAKKDAVQAKMVDLDTEASDNMVSRSLSAANLTVGIDLVNPETVGVVSRNVSGITDTDNLEHTNPVIVAEDITRSSRECVQQKQGTSDVSGGEETSNRNLVASISLEAQFDAESQRVSMANLPSGTKEYVHHSIGAELHGKRNGNDEQSMLPIVSAVGSVGSVCDGKHQISEANIVSIEETAYKSPPSSTNTLICPVSCSSTITSMNSSYSDLKASFDVEALNHVERAPYRDSLENDVDALKGDNDVTSVEPDCGSPTIISCSEPCVSEDVHHEGEEQWLVQNCPTSASASCAPADISVCSDKPKATDQTPQTPQGSDVAESDKSFTFEVGKLATSFVNEKNGKGWKPFPSSQPIESFQTNHKGPGERGSRGGQAGKEQKTNEIGKDRSTGKSRSKSGSGSERMASGKGRPAKEPFSTSLTSSIIRDDNNLVNVSANSGGCLLGSPAQVEEGKKLAYIDSISTKPYPIKASQTPNLSDLNALASPVSGLFQQPFTDIQQLQLRAQIFVYGSLIQGAAPDENCMISAFGESGRDGGRRMWENAWHVAAERCRSQKSWANSEVSPIVYSGMKTTEQKGNSVQGKNSMTSAGRTANKSSSISQANPAVSLPSSMSTSSRDAVQANSVARTSLADPHTTLTPIQLLYPSPHIRPVAGYPNAWPSHVSSPVPWILSPQTSALDAGSPYANFPVPETVQTTFIQDHPVGASVCVTSGGQPVASSPLSAAVSSATVLPSMRTEVRTTIASGRQPSTDHKPRKRKKSVPSEENQLLCVHPSPAESGSPAVTTKHIPASIPANEPSTLPFASAVPESKTASGEPMPPNPPMMLSTIYQVISGGNTEQRAIYSEDACSQIEQAKFQAENAAAGAASAVRHSQDIWSQLAVQRNSGLVSDVEEKLASAAVAASAAASVAKAAAAAAKVASDAALQAKLMADEALKMNKMVTSIHGSETGISEGMKTSVLFTASSFFKGKVKQGISSSALEFAREAARKRVEAASAATRQAQNLDAVVKAAELAAEAISQAAAVVAMGDPIPLTLNELFDAGPEGYWRHQDVSRLFTKKANAMEIGWLSNGTSGEPNSLNVKSSSDKDIRGSDERSKNASKQSSKQSIENRSELINGTHDVVPIIETTEAHQLKMRGVSHSISDAGTIPLSEFESRNTSIPMPSEDLEKNERSEDSNQISIKQGLLVEVASDEEGLRTVWFTARVLEVKDGKAHVCYNDLLSDEGPGQLKEWIPLGVGDGKAPRIRIAHPMTAMKFEGTRKRRRAAMGNYNWSVGDHVDAWMRDGWWEGIITEKSKEDETKLTVHFPAEGDVRTARAWNIRPSLVWNDGQWVEWSRETGSWLKEGDAPLDKRQKLDGKLENDSALDKGKEDPLKTASSDSSAKHQESTPLDLPNVDTLFSVGKSTAEDTNLAAGRIKRTGLQKEGSRVVFGVPKPGKKRKFMDVSKHFGTEQVSKIGETNNVAKFSKYLMPQKSSGLKSTSKDDPKGGRVANTRSKDVRLGKLQGSQSKSRSEKVVSSVSFLPPPSGTIETGPTIVQPCISHEDNLDRQNQTDIVPGFPKVLNASGPFSSIERDSDVFPHGKKPLSAVDSRSVPKVKLAAAGGRVSSDEEKGKLGSDLIEPRRSNRRIQPTSRLLEGLQSSLTVGKVSSSVMHEKGCKSSNRSINSSAKGNSYG